MCAVLCHITPPAGPPLQSLRAQDRLRGLRRAYPSSAVEATCGFSAGFPREFQLGHDASPFGRTHFFCVFPSVSVLLSSLDQPI